MKSSPTRADCDRVCGLIDQFKVRHIQIIPPLGLQFDLIFLFICGWTGFLNVQPGGNPMLIAKITRSNSHVNYFARVLDSLETSVNLTPADFQFGQFVKIKVGDEDVIGMIYNSQLITPKYGNFGPRLSTPAKLNTVFSPDYLNEQGILISILLLGWRNGEESRQDTPRVVLPLHSHVETMDDEEIHAFH